MDLYKKKQKDFNCTSLKFIRKTFLLIYVFSRPIISIAQTDSIKDYRLFYGLSFGINYSNLHSASVLPGGAKIRNGLGLSEGFAAYFRATKKLEITGIADISFNRSRVEYSSFNNTKTDYSVFKFSLDLAVHLTYKIGNGKKSPFITFGPCYRLPVNFKFNKPLEQKTKPNFAIDLGIGLENKYEFFTFAPELRYSYGFGNVSRNDAFRNLTFHNIAFILNIK